MHSSTVQGKYIDCYNEIVYIKVAESHNLFLFDCFRTESDQFMMVYASNQPSQFDEAVLDRIDEMVEFELWLCIILVKPLIFCS